jgi:hypothetical protein
MAPLYPGFTVGKRFPLLAERNSQPTRESLTEEGGFLEAWAQGYNVGSLIILLLIVFCNYRSGQWLHKLIVLEVGLQTFSQFRRPFVYMLTQPARPRLVAWYLYFRLRSPLRMVPLLYRNPPLHILPTPQRRLMVENPPLPSPLGLPRLHHHPDPRPTLLDRRSLVQLRIL